MTGFDRRKFLRISAATGAVLIASPLSRAIDLPEVIKPAGKFEDGRTQAAGLVAVEVTGMYADLLGVISIDPGRVTMAISEAPAGDRPEYRTYTYGSARYEDLSLVVQLGPKNAKLKKWVEGATRQDILGDAQRRDIVVRMLDRKDRSVIRTYRCFGCLPASVAPIENSPRPGDPRVEIRCKVGRVEIA